MIRRIQHQDRDAFAELFRRYRRPLQSYIGRVVGDAAVAEELTQELFLVIWRDARRFRGRASGRTWIYRIAYNQAVSWLRKKKPVLWEEPPEMESHEPLPETQALLAEQREKIVASLAELSPDHRTVIELTFYHQMSYREIAQVMDCPVGTVKSRMSYARRHLAAVLRRKGLEGG